MTIDEVFNNHQSTEVFLDERQVAEWLRISIYTLRDWRRVSVTNHGPSFIRFGRTIRYSHNDVLAWIAQHKVTPD